MRRFILCLLFLFSTAATAVGTDGDWKLLDENEEAKVYLDEGSIEVNKERKTLTLILKTDLKNHPKQLKHTLSIFHVKCDLMMSALVEQYMFFPHGVAQIKFPKPIVGSLIKDSPLHKVCKEKFSEEQEQEPEHPQDNTKRKYSV